jgi:predicted ATPase/DNA-binding CsgD family transcriptional regulator
VTVVSPVKPASALRPIPDGFPAYLTRFVGRQAEVEAVMGLLGVTQVVTISGAGGAGKTRLVIEVARRAGGLFPDGQRWVPLATCDDPRLLDGFVASAVGLRQSFGPDVVRSVSGVFQGKRLLLVLDNCEHLGPACGELVSRLVAGCPGLAVLTTSRSLLKIGSETVYAIPPLGSWAATGRAEEDEPDDEASDLFFDRAGIGDPAWSTSRATRTVVRQICGRLGGSPLGIELAAGWIRVLSPDDLLAELDGNLEHLSAVDSTVIGRHQHLSSVLQSTWDWLSEHEQRIMAALSVFVGGFSRTAAQEVAGASLSTLAGLTERALIQRLPQLDGGTRYHVHELVRSFTLARLTETSERLLDLRLRHFQYFDGLAQAALGVWDTPAEQAALDALDADVGNVDAALAGALDRGQATEALRMAGALFSHWIYRSPMADRRDMLDRLLALPQESGADPAVRARALNVAGYAHLTTDRDRAEQLFVEGLRHYRLAGDRRGEAWALRGYGYVHLTWGDTGFSQRCSRESLEICSEIGDESGVAWSLHDLAEAAFAAGDLGQAEQLLLQSLVALDRAGLTFGSYRGRLLVAEIQRRRGDHLGALTGFAETLRIQRKHHYTLKGADLLECVAALAVDLGRPELSVGLFGAARTWHQTYGFNRFCHDQPHYDKAYGIARRQVGLEDWDAAFGAGCRRTPEQAQSDLERAIIVLTEWCEHSLMTGLTSREIEVLRHVSQGISDADIAAHMVLSPRTVQAHLRSIYDKLGVHSRTAAALEAVRLNLS